MKLVTFSRAMAPHGVGDTRLVPDNVAAQLDEDGMISSSEPWPAQVRPPRQIVKPVRPAVKPVRPMGQLDLRVAE